MDAETIVKLMTDYLNSKNKYGEFIEYCKKHGVDTDTVQVLLHK